MWSTAASRTALVWIGILAIAFLSASPADATIGVAKDAERSGRQVTFDFYLENFGVSTLNPVTLTDDLDATFGVGNHMIVSGPAFVVDPGTLTLNGGFDGSSDIDLISGGTLNPGVTAQITLTVEILTVTDVGFGLGIYYNQATAVANSGAFIDLSDDGTDPDPDGNGDPTDADEDDPTLIDFTEIPRLGVAKTAILDGTEVTFDVYLENLGNRTLSNLTLPDDLDSVFGAGNYSVTTGPTLIDDPGTVTVNAGFDGSGDDALITSGSLTATDTARIRFVVDVTTVTDQGAGLGVYSNQVNASGTSPFGTPVSDLSDAGTDPDPGGDGQAGGPDEDDPTIFVIGEDPVLGVAKTASVNASDVTFDFYLENLGDVELVTLELEDDLDSVFGTDNYGITVGPVLIDDPGTLSLNASFDGSADTALITSGTLAIADTAQIRLVVRVFALADLGAGLGVYENQVTAVGTSAAGGVATDDSDSGTDPDPSGDGDPGGAGEDDPTGFSVAQIPVIGVAKTAAVTPIGSNYQIALTFYLENLGNVPLSNVSLVDDLAAVFGAGNFGSVGDPVVTQGSGGTLVRNAAYTGSGVNELLTGGGLEPRAFALVEVGFVLTTVTDQGFGTGIYMNQATANADGPSGAAPADVSDSGSVPDPDGDGNPSEAGEDDPTVITVAAYLGVAENATVTGDEVTLDFYVENFSLGTVSDLGLATSLDGVFGAGNYVISSSPNLVDDPGTLNLNGGFDGSADNELLAAGSSLVAGDTAQIRLEVTLVTVVNLGDGLGSYRDQVQVVGTAAGGMVLTDSSDAGTDPDTDGDGNPTGAGNNDVTTFTVNVDPVVGVAKDALVSGSQVTLDFYLENFGSVNSGDLVLVDDLDSVLGAGNYTIVTGPILVVDPGTLVVNGAYDGSGDPNLLSAGSSLNSGATAQIQVVVDVTTLSDRGFGTGVYRNQATLMTTTANGLAYSDLSAPGTDPDPNGDGDPTQPAATEDESTLFFFGEPVLGTAMKVYVQGTQITFDFYFENLGDVEVTGIEVRLPLNPVFGSGNYSIFQQPTQIEGSGLVPSPQWFGFNIFDRVILDGTLGVGESARVRAVVKVNNVTDQGSGLGVYSAQITADAFAVDGVTPVSDLSDDGILTDPNGNGDPSEAAEDDATLMIIGEESTLGVAKNASVSGSQVTLDYFLENLGNVTIDNVTMEDDLDAVFGAGNYNVASISTIAGGTFPPENPSFDGTTDMELFAAGGALGAGNLVQVQVVVNVTSVVDQGLGLGNYENQVIVSGTGPSATVAQDLSDGGVDPDPNGNGNPADVGEGDPTTFSVGTSSIGIAKAASVAGDMVMFDFFVENLGSVALTNIVLADDLDAVFGAGNYAIAAPPEIVGDLHGLSGNPGFDGSSDTSLVAPGGSIPAGTLEQLRVIVQVIQLSDQGSGLGVYSNQVTVSSGAVSDLSDAGTSPDPDGDGDADEAGENDPTPFTVAENATVGVAKTASVSGGTVTMDFYLENFANVAPQIALADDLDAVLGAGNYALTSGPTLMAGPGTVVVNGSYNGSADSALLAAGSTLAVDATAQVRIVVAVNLLTDQGAGLGVYENQASLTATGPGGTMSSDVSDAGSNPDPDGDGQPNEAGENDPTPFTVAENPTVGVAKSAAVSGDTVTLDFYLESFGNVAAEVALEDGLDAVFGAGNYTLTSGPTLISGPGTVVVNGGYDGSVETALLAAGSTLAVGASAQIELEFTVDLLTDQGFGVGVYENQADLTATGPGATVATDPSDDGSDPDANGNGIPDEAGENDPTPIMLVDDVPPTVSNLETNLGSLAACDTELSAVTRIEVTIEDDRSAIVGADATSSYLLVEAGPDAEFSTTACGGAAGDDLEVSFTGATLQGADPPAAEVYLTLPAPGLPAGLYRFLVCDTVADAFGNALDGDTDTVPGGDFVLPFFRADPGNLFANGHFDDCPASLEPWTDVATLPNFIEPGDAGVDDYQTSSVSASAAFTQSAEGASTLGQCVPVGGGDSYQIESRLRFAAAPGAAAFFVRTCEFFGGAGCGGASLGDSTVASVVEDGGGEWDFFTRSIVSPAGAASALCDFALQSLGVDPGFHAHLDGLRLLSTETVLFTDGFESGDTSMWSVTVP